MAVGRDTKAFTECVAMHHLRLQPGVFRLKGRLNLPPGVSGRLAKNTGSIKALQVTSICMHPGCSCLLALIATMCLLIPVPPFSHCVNTVTQLLHPSLFLGLLGLYIAYVRSSN